MVDIAKIKLPLPQLNKKLITIFFLLLAAISTASKRNNIERYFANRSTEKFTIDYLPSSFDRRPEPGDLFVPSNEDSELLEETLNKIFPDGLSSVLSEEEKCIEILRFVSSSLTLNNNDGTASKIIKDGYSYCGGMSYSFIILCRKIGIPTRYVGSAYSNSMKSHSIAEAYYSYGWRLFDPTFGIFFYSNGSYDKKGSVASFHDLAVSSYRWTPFKVVNKPWIGRYDKEIKGFGIIRAEEDYMKINLGKPISDFYKEELKDSFPLAYGGNDLVSFPVDADLNEKIELQFGNVDGSGIELSNYNNRFSGSGYLGRSIPPAYHTWLIKAPAKSRIRIEYYSLKNESPILQLTSLRAANLIESRREGKKTIFSFYTNAEESIVSIFCAKGTYLIDAMKITRSEMN